MVLAALLLLAAADHKHENPQQIHLAFGGPSAMNVAWYTDDKMDSVVQYGTTASLGTNVTGKRTQYLKNHGYHHSATLTGLTPGGKYFYRVGDGGARVSDVLSFKAAPTDDDVSFSVNIFGDMGWLGSEERPMAISLHGLERDWSAMPSRYTMENLKNNGEIDFVWHVGDIAYADDSFGHKSCEAKFCYEHTYNGFMNWMQNVSSVMPYMVTVGNHESECHSPACLLDPFLKDALGNFTAYNHRWHMPSSTSNGRASMWYAFDYGPARFIGINTETDFPGAGEEKKGDGGFTKAGSFGQPGEYLAWVERQLDMARQSGKWVIVGGHRSFKHCNKLGGVCELLDKYNATIYFAGHGHSYARSVSAGGMPTIMVGGAGCDEKANVLDETSVWEFERAQATGGFATNKTATGVLTVTKKQLSWRLIEGSTQKVLDTLTVTR